MFGKVKHIAEVKHIKVLSNDILNFDFDAHISLVSIGKENYIRVKRDDEDSDIYLPMGQVVLFILKH